MRGNGAAVVRLHSNGKKKNSALERLRRVAPVAVGSTPPLSMMSPEGNMAAAYRMRTWVTRELRALVETSFPLRSDKRGILGHSMGGHGALTIALGLPGEYGSVSAFAPIVAPSQVPWGQKAFAGYLGDDRAAWAAHDATALVKQHRAPGTVLIDQGLSDKFLERELRPELFEAACAEAGQPLELRRHAGYDHSYWFIATFVEDHLRHHARALGV